MKLSKCPRQHERHEQRPKPQNNHMLPLAQLKPTSVDHQQVSQNQIGRSPQDVDRR